MDELTAQRRTLFRFVATAIGVVVVAFAGYVGFVMFVDSGAGSAASVMVLAAGTGFAAFFSPCSFPLLLTFLAKRSRESTAGALISALRVAAGAGLLLVLVAAGIAIGGSGLARVVEFDSLSGRVFRLIVGVVLIAFGLLQSRLFVIRMGWLDLVAAVSARRLDPNRVTGVVRQDVVYGFGYLLAGFG